MNRKEAERITRQQDTLVSLGFTRDESESLRRISMTLRRWHEMECGTGHGCVERDEETGLPYWVSEFGARWGMNARTRRRIPDRETGARKRLAAILKARNSRGLQDHVQRHFKGGFSYAMFVTRPEGDVQAYIQTDPRGAALYILRPGDVPEGADVSSYYSRGVCVY